MANAQSKVPTISLQDKDFAEKLFGSLKYYGFIILRDHPVSIDLLAEAYQLSEAFFALSAKTKNKYFLAGQAGARGYTPFGREHAKDAAVPDLKEFWHVGRDKNVWPEELANFESTFTRLFDELDNVGRWILRALTPHLGVENDFFDKMTEQGNSILRLLHYPPLAQGVDPRCLRAAAHEDINLITILVSASTSGLELKDRNGQWQPVESEPMELVVDSGDMLSRLTNDVIPSTTHRVVNPSGPNVSRYSMPFFMHPKPTASLACLESCRGEKEKYSPILADEFLQQRLHEIGLR
jgi:isopenicillin N synthase-like dioxygenase